MAGFSKEKKNSNTSGRDQTGLSRFVWIALIFLKGKKWAYGTVLCCGCRPAHLK